MRFRILKLGELGEVSFGMLKFVELGQVIYGIYKLGELGKVSFGMLNSTVVVSKICIFLPSQNYKKLRRKVSMYSQTSIQSKISTRKILKTRLFLMQKHRERNTRLTAEPDLQRNSDQAKFRPTANLAVTRYCQIVEVRKASQVIQPSALRVLVV